MDGLHREVVELTQALIRLDTTNAPGNETLAARLLQEYLEDAGVECELVARDPDRANLVARVAGSDPDAPSLAFVGHTDVVPVDPRDWTHPPFAAVVDDDGWLYGRGADRHEERGGRPRRRAQGARPQRLPAAGRPVVPRRRRRGGRHGRRGHALAARAAARHPAGPQRQRGRRRASAARGRARGDERRRRREGHLPGPGHRRRRGRSRLHPDRGRQRRAAARRAAAPDRPRHAHAAALRAGRRDAHRPARATPATTSSRRSATPAGCTPSWSTTCPRWSAPRWRRPCSAGRASAT